MSVSVGKAVTSQNNNSTNTTGTASSLTARTSPASNHLLLVGGAPQLLLIFLEVGLDFCTLNHIVKCYFEFLNEVHALTSRRHNFLANENKKYTELNTTETNLIHIFGENLVENWRCSPYKYFTGGA